VALDTGSLDYWLSKPNTKKGCLQRACYALLQEHRRDGALPTSVRFLFYELVGRGVVSKTATGSRRADQDISDAIKHLRDVNLVPWSWIVDETRSLDSWRYAESAYRYVADILPSLRIDPWDGLPPPLIMCESRHGISIP
jgi:hypothetical protein